MHLRSIAVLQGVNKSENDAHHGDERANLNHSPGRPVEGDEVLAIAELKGHQGEGLHDDNNGGGADAGEADGNVNPEQLRASLGVLAVLFQDFEAPATLCQLMPSRGIVFDGCVPRRTLCMSRKR